MSECQQGPCGDDGGSRHAFAPVQVTVMEAPDAIPYAWQRWAVAQLVGGRGLGDVVAEMVSRGLNQESSYAVCLDLASHPAVEVARWSAERLAKLESVLNVRQQLRDLTPVGSEVEHLSGLSGQEFLEDYYSANLPVVLTDVADGWAAVNNWSPSYLARSIGSEPVEIMTDRDSDEQFEVNSNSHRSTMPFDQYVEHVTAAAWSNDKYLVANNHLLEKPAAAALWPDFAIDERYLDPGRTDGSVFLWFGPGGTVTPLHHDVANVLFVQVYGRKLVRLRSPLESHCVYNDIGVYSQVDAAQPDLDAHPLFARTRPFNVLLEPGQALFIPVGWWHHVTALDTSISLSFTNFHWPNAFEWRHPHIAR
jgi:Cupin-like domain